jgi:prevent-host-death family protein
MSGPNFQIDLQHGVVPISRAAASIAALIKRSAANAQPIIITQKGYPTGVLLSIELFTSLRELAESAASSESTPEVASAAALLGAATPEPEPPAAKRRARKPAAAPAEVLGAPAEAAPAPARRGRAKKVAP